MRRTRRRPGRLEPLAHRHPFFRQLPFRAFVLGQLRQTHAAQNVWSLGELDVVIAHDLDAIAPGVAEIQKRTVDRLDPRSLEGGARRLLVVDNEAEMPAVISGLFASRLQRDELVAKIDEGHRLALAAQLKVENAAIECQRFLDIANFQRYVVEADGARLCGVNHLTLLLQSVDGVYKLDHNIVHSHGGSANPLVLLTGGPETASYCATPQVWGLK